MTTPPDNDIPILGGPVTAKPSGEKKCLCVKWHRPKPLILHAHHVWPLGDGGPDEDENLVWLCPTTHNNVHQLWRLTKKFDQGVVPLTLRRPYTDYAREIVDRGLAQKYPR